ncbi:AfsR-like transcriptional regulator TcrA [Actinoallomurus oryzae]|uniref:AfsR-like transcriptional regulator TcrA n=1 Tax=Actinoallomurus oryzae TaxID=502180 RepID=A0ABP8QPA2_9ACTN
MGTGGAVERFSAELRSLHHAAGRPTLDRLVRHCRAQKPPITTSDATIHGWLTGTNIPSERSERAFSHIVGYLREEVRERGGDPSAHFPDGWKNALARARVEKRANRGGRPRKARAVRAAGGPPPRPVPMTLPPDPAGFTGRAAALAELAERLDGADQAITVVTGMGGVGKTALAVRAAHRAGRFSGGTLFLDLGGFGQGGPLEAGDAAERLLRMLGVADPGGTPPEPVGRWRTALAASADRPLLIVLDNAASAGQVAPLLPDPPHHVIITSRTTLSTLAAHRVGLAPLDAGESVRLLDRALRSTLPDDDRVTACPRDAERLAALCGRLPLALRIVAALLLDDPHRPLADEVAALGAARDRLDRLRYDDVDEQGRPLGVRAAFDLSYARLGAEQRRAFDLLGAVPGPDFGSEAAAAVLDRTPPEAERLLAGLTRLHLVQGRPGRRWDLHDLVRLYATEHARADAEGYRDALDRLLEHYEGATTDADRRFTAPGTLRLFHVNRFASRAQALDWLDAEHRNVAAAVTAAHEAGLWRRAYEPALRLARYLEFRRHADEWIACARLALDAAEHLEPERVPPAALSLGNACRVAGRYEEAERQLRRALDLAPDRPAEGNAWHNLGLVYWGTGDYAKAVECHRNDLRICTDAGDLLGAAQSLCALGDALRMREEYEEAAASLVRAIEVFEKLEDAGGLMRARINLALVLLGWNPVLYGACGIWHLCHALRLARERDDHHGEAVALLDLGALYLSICPACYGSAVVRCATRAVALFTKHDEPLRRAHATRALGRGLLAVGDLARARRVLDRASDSLEALGVSLDDDVPADAGTRTPHIPGCFGRQDKKRFRWLARLPDDVIRGDFRYLDEFTWIGFRYLTPAGKESSP